MRNLPRSAQIYVYVVFSLGVFAALAALPALFTNFWLFLPTGILAGLIAIFDLMPVNFRGHHAEVLPSSAIKLAGVVLVPPPVILLGVFCGTLLSEWRLKRVWYKLIFNVGALTLTYVVVVLAFTLLHDPSVGILGSASNLTALALMGVSDVAVNSLLIALVIALSEQESVVYIWAQTFKPLVLNDLSMLPIGVFMALLWNASWPSVVLGAAPLLVVRRAAQTVIDLETQTRDALMALAKVLDERDEATSHHCELVAQYAGDIARQLGLGPGEVDVIERAAWLHDIGKVGMRNHILFKPGTLTREERQEAQHHAVIGGDLLTKFPLFEKGAVYVRHHHEWWDGSGYPDKLRGEQIPLGARILAVADAYQAMVVERPYRKPLSEEGALEELRTWAGTQFDPRVVQALFYLKGVPFREPKIERARVTADPVGSLAE